MLATKANTFGLVIASHVNVGATLGVSVTPAQNAYGSYAQVIAGASLTDDAYGIWININSGNVSAAVRDTLVTIGIDPAGGTSYTDTINHLLGSCAAAYNGASIVGGHFYYFPIRIRAGSSVGAKASVNNATVGTINVAARFFCRPTRPELIRYGSYVKTFGEVTATSKGTDVTSGGSNAKGSWVQLGSNLTESLWFWQIGHGMNQTGMNNNGSLWDLGLGDGSNNRIVIADRYVQTNAAEILATPHGAEFNAHMEGTSGVGVYARAASPGTAQTGWSAAAYGVGG